MQGFINIYKPSGVTSAYVVSKLKKHLNIKKIGHMGTLDPLASGILPIALGKATRMFDYFLEKDKEYIAVFDFGYETDTLDIEGQVINECSYVPTETEILEALKELTGNLSQMPPKFSAKKVNGRKAYELAREGQDFDLKPKNITVNKFELLERVSDKSFKFLINCSSGTYIRSLGRDLGYKTNSLGTMSALERSKSGFFEVNNSVNFDLLLSEEKSMAKIMPIYEVFPQFNKIEVTNEEYIKLKNGMTIKTHLTNQKAFVFWGDSLLGLSEITNGNMKIIVFLLED